MLLISIKEPLYVSPQVLSPSLYNLQMSIWYVKEEFFYTKQFLT